MATRETSGAEKAAWVMSVVSLGVTGLDLLAMVRWPAVDMGGVVARMMLFALSMLELGPFIAFAAMSWWMRSRPPEQHPRTLVIVGILLALPVVALGTWVGFASLTR